ncbi:MAG: glycosyltransferase family 1 protein, partial [Candidatus Thermofonsia Clade 3 bacterium]
MAKLVYLVTEDWYFVSHRLALAKAAQSAGFDVMVVTRCGAACR